MTTMFQVWYNVLNSISNINKPLHELKKKKRKSQIWIQDLNLNSSNSSFKKNQKKNKTKPGADGTLNQGPDVQNYKDFPTDHIDIFKLQQ